MVMSGMHEKVELHSQSGFGLVEVMVGMVIGLLATLVIMQVFSTYENQRRATTGSSDAQTNGSIALFNLQRDIQMAGYGLPMPMADPENSSLKCNLLPEYDPDADPVTDNSIKLFPIEIENGVDDSSDIIKVRYSRNAAGAVPTKIVNHTPINDIVVDHNLGCKDGDVAMINQGNACMMTLVATVAIDGYGHGGGSNDDTHIGLVPTTPLGPPLSNSAMLTCMGDWQEYRYVVVNNQLRRQTISGNLADNEDNVLVDEIVVLQAQYGVSATADSNRVTEWRDATGNWTPANLAANVDRRNRIKAVRVAVVARSGQRENEVVTQVCTTDKGTVNNGPCAWDDTDFDAAPKIDLSPLYAVANEWQHYRYRSFETIVPLRNMLWSRDAL
ncbi:MAG: prepilin-type cleavage/methylation domain-containing protein [Betaproteobacteria bacterium HGW-Betaproteobacteria-8]|nr:MAG: prepilin-type cleavage/methylation domain-containing protein [Betaproteobacteria bacterium HGW-Betaproteobacteria-8]